MSDCVVCSTPVQNRARIACSDFKRLCHGNCVNMTKQDIDCIFSKKKMWRCPPCQDTRRIRMSAVTTAGKGEADTSQLEDVEQYSRLNSVEIFGVPEGKNEDTYEVVNNIGVALDLNVTRGSIDVFHRLRRPAGRRNLYAAAREAKKTRKYTYLWIQNGNILLRKDQESSVVRIASMDDLDGL
ncbi:hypothetical protein J6590_037056 [Homalodisca vitripennis]|nr:hypothetical protein J6590_037056 [Homalodisca vitripennis]